MARGWDRPRKRPPASLSLGHSKCRSPPGRGHSVVGPQEPAGFGCRSQDQRMAEVGGTFGSPQPHQAPLDVPSPIPGGFGDPPAPGPGARAPAPPPAQKCCWGPGGASWLQAAPGASAPALGSATQSPAPASCSSLRVHRAVDEMWSDESS